MKIPVEKMLPVELDELAHLSPDPAVFDEAPMRAAAAESRPQPRGARIVELRDEVDIDVAFFAHVANVIEQASTELELLGVVDLDAVATQIAERVRPSIAIVRTLHRITTTSEIA